MTVNNFNMVKINHVRTYEIGNIMVDNFVTVDIQLTCDNGESIKYGKYEISFPIYRVLKSLLRTDLAHDSIFNIFQTLQTEMKLCNTQ